MVSNVCSAQAGAQEPFGEPLRKCLQSTVRRASVQQAIKGWTFRQRKFQWTGVFSSGAGRSFRYVWSRATCPRSMLRSCRRWQSAFGKALAPKAGVSHLRRRKEHICSARICSEFIPGVLAWQTRLEALAQVASDGSTEQHSPKSASKPPTNRCGGKAHSWKLSHVETQALPSRSRQRFHRAFSQSQGLKATLSIS